MSSNLLAKAVALCLCSHTLLLLWLAVKPIAFNYGKSPVLSMLSLSVQDSETLSCQIYSIEYGDKHTQYWVWRPTHSIEYGDKYTVLSMETNTQYWVCRQTHSIEYGDEHTQYWVWRPTHSIEYGDKYTVLILWHNKNIAEQCYWIWPDIVKPKSPVLQPACVWV